MKCLAGPLPLRWQDRQNPGGEPKDLSAPARSQTALLQHLARGLGGTNHPEGKSSVGQCHRNLPRHLSNVPSRADLQSFAHPDGKSAWPESFGPQGRTAKCSSPRAARGSSAARQGAESLAPPPPRSEQTKRDRHLQTWLLLSALRSEHSRLSSIS